MRTPKNYFETRGFTPEGERIILFRIQATVNTPIKFSRIPYIRISSYKRKLEEHPEKQGFIRNKKPGSAFEKGVAIHVVEPDQVLSLLDYPSYFDLMKTPLPEKRKAIFENIEQEKILEKKGANMTLQT